MTRPRMATEQLADVEEQGSSPLDTFTVNLNELALQGKIDPLIGRKTEVQRTIQILCRRRKNNPLYVGEAGVGKTAIAEGLQNRLSMVMCRKFCLIPRSIHSTWVLY